VKTEAPAAEARGGLTPGSVRIGSCTCRLPSQIADVPAGEVRRQRPRAGAEEGEEAHAARLAASAPESRVSRNTGEERRLRLAPSLQEGAEAHAAATPLLGAAPAQRLQRT
jgi:hypothetical protein